LSNPNGKAAHPFIPLQTRLPTEDFSQAEPLIRLSRCKPGCRLKTFHRQSRSSVHPVANPAADRRLPTEDFFCWRACRTLQACRIIAYGLAHRSEMPPSPHTRAAGGTIPELQPQLRDGLLILQAAKMLPAK